MAEKFMQHEGVETGYFAKRKKQFNDEIAKGIASTEVKAKVGSKKKMKTNSKRDIENVPKPKDNNEKDSV